MPALGSRHASLLGIAPSQIAPLLPLQQDVQLAKATGENWHFINCVCVQIKQMVRVFTLALMLEVLR